MSRAALYLRESTMKGAKADRYGLPEQRRAATEYCEQQGFDVVDEYVDIGADSGQLQRPELDRLRADLKLGLFDVVVFPRVDRSARDMGVGNTLYSEVEQAGVKVAFADPGEQFEDSAEGHLMRTIKLYTAQKDRERIRSNTQNARHARARSGLAIPGWKCPWGWRWADTKKTHAYPDEEALPDVRRLFDLTAEGVGRREVCRRFNAERVRMPGGGYGTWTPANVDRILRDPRYIGEAYAYRKRTHTVNRRLPDGSYKTNVLYTTNRPADDPTLVRLPDGVFPALIERDVWDRVQERLSRAREQAARNNTDPEATLLRGGIAVCGGCGRTMRVKRMANAKTEWAYACNTPSCHGNIKLARGATGIDEAVWALVQDAVAGSDWLMAQALAWSERQARQTQRAGEDAGHLAGRSRELERKRANLTAAVAEADTPDERAMWRQQVHLVSEELKQVEALRAQLANQALAGREQAERFEQAVRYLNSRSVQLLRGDMTYEEKRDLLADLDARVVIWREDVFGPGQPRWLLFLGWTGWLVERLHDADAWPAPVRAGELVDAAGRGRVDENADGVSGNEPAALSEAQRAALEPALTRAMGWLTRPKQTRHVGLRARDGHDIVYHTTRFATWDSGSRARRR